MMWKEREVGFSSQLSSTGLLNAEGGSRDDWLIVKFEWFPGYLESVGQMAWL